METFDTIKLGEIYYCPVIDISGVAVSVMKMYKTEDMVTLLHKVNGNLMETRVFISTLEKV